jgi:exodeoxyribonuclease V gamma subunit
MGSANLAILYICIDRLRNEIKPSYMSLHLIESPHQEQLAEALVQHMNPVEGSEDSLDSMTVIVQNAGLGRWLRLWHARHCGISAGVKMPFAQAFIAKELEAQQLYDRWQALDPAVMRWQIFDLLQRRAFDAWSDAGPLVEYLNPSHANVERRCWSLSASLADLYDRYAVHRPEWITTWLQDGQPSDELPHLKWQAQLFRDLVAKMGLQPENVERRLLGVALQHSFTQELSVSDDPCPLHVFGITSFPPAFLKFFQRLAETREVTLYHLIPSEAYLGELPKNYRTLLQAELENGEFSGEGADLLDNSLLVANGQAASRFQSLLLALDYPSGELPELSEAQPSTDLLQLQNAVRMNEPECEFFADGSFSLHRCHSRIREVQVLQQQLLAQFAADPSLRPEDIMVLVPEIADYTDAINSVFGMGTRLKPGDHPTKIPFCIADQKSSGDENCWRFFSALLSLLKGRQLFSEVAALLDFDPVCQRLSLDRDVLKELLNTLQVVGVRWGIDQASRSADGFPDYEAYTWDYGLQRLYDGLIYGDEALYDDRAPYVASSRMLEAVGSLTQFLRPVFDLAAKRTQRLSFRQWAKALLAVLDQTLGSEGHGSGEWMRLLAVAIGDLQEASTDVEIGFDTFCMMLEEGDFSESGPSGLLRRGVTFCRLQPARHIPAKVVCILGLDEGSYPRQEKFLEFDLINLQCRHAKDLRGTKLAYRELHYLGDSHMRDEDRQLFLDCMLNAKDRLYLSYVGQSELSNEKLPPSLLVSELRQFLERVPGGSEAEVKSRKELVDRVSVRHPLQEWSKDNFQKEQPEQGEPPVPLHFNLQIANLQRDAVLPDSFLSADASPASLSKKRAFLTAKSLRNFLVDPAAAYLKQQFRLDLDPLKWSKLAKDQESFSVDNLDHWSLREDLLNQWLIIKQNGKRTVEFATEYKRQLELTLRLPVGSAGKQFWNDELSPLIEMLKQFDEVEFIKKHESSHYGDVCFQHEYWETADGKRIIFLNGDCDLVKKTKYYLDAFIGHIGSQSGSLIVNLKGRTLSEWPSFSEVEFEPSTGNWLSTVLGLWEKSQERPLEFSPVIAARYLALIAEKPELSPEEALTVAYLAGWETDYGDADATEAQKLCFDGDSPASPSSDEQRRKDFVKNTESIMGPVYGWLAATKPIKKGKK